jgi:hypothetical protein
MAAGLSIFLSHTVAPFSFSLLFWLLQNQEENRRAALLPEEKLIAFAITIFSLTAYKTQECCFPFYKKTSSRLSLTQFTFPNTRQTRKVQNLLLKKSLVGPHILDGLKSHPTSTISTLT